MKKISAYLKGSFHSFRTPFLFVVFITLILILSGTSMAGSGQQEMMHDMSHKVMPFDISKTTHIFEMTETGGVQQVIAKDPKDAEQIRLIRNTYDMKLCASKMEITLIRHPFMEHLCLD
jgi:hypothetical protein